MQIYFPEYYEKVRFKSEISAGADWVTRQLVIWAYSLPRNEDGTYIKSVGIFDFDLKGLQAIEELNRSIVPSSAESKCVKAFKYSAKYARHLIPIYRKGIQLPISLEEMFDFEHWKIALERKWLENRQNVDMLLNDPTNWDKMTMSLKEHIRSIGFTSDEEVYLQKFKNEEKENFRKYIMQLGINLKKEALKCFRPFLLQVLEALFPKDTFV